MNPDFLDLLSALLAVEARFMVVGAYAVAVHGRAAGAGARTSDAVDASVVVTSDPKDLVTIAAALGRKIAVTAV